MCPGEFPLRVELVMFTILRCKKPFSTGSESELYFVNRSQLCFITSLKKMSLISVDIEPGCSFLYVFLATAFSFFDIKDQAQLS